MQATSKSWCITDLPIDALVSVLAHLPVVSLGITAQVCRCLRDASARDDLWHHLLQRDYEMMLERVFDGECPAPPRNLSWRDHYLTFEDTWLTHTRQHGRIILEIEGIIYDVTHYIHKHPGEPELLLAAAGTDASEVFAAIGHTSNARRILSEHAIASKDELLLHSLHWLRPLPPSSLLVRTMVRSVMTDMLSEAGRSRLKQLARAVASAVLHDLTEGRPGMCSTLSTDPRARGPLASTRACPPHQLSCGPYARCTHARLIWTRLSRVNARTQTVVDTRPLP